MKGVESVYHSVDSVLKVYTGVEKVHWRIENVLGALYMCQRGVSPRLVMVTLNCTYYSRLTSRLAPLAHYKAPTTFSILQC